MVAVSKLSGIASSGANLVAADTLIGVHGGNTDFQFTGTQVAAGVASIIGLSIASGKTLTVSNSLTLAGTDSTTMTFPTTSATIARTDAGQTFTGNQAIAAGGDIEVYNTADQTTNFEKLSILWTGNTAIISTTKGGTGTLRSTQLNGGQSILLATGAATRFVINGTDIFSNTSGGGAFRAQATSATLPAFVPNQSDTTTGIGAQAAGNLSIIVGAVEVARFISGTSFLINPATQLGAANAASPVAQTLQAQGSRGGTDTNVGGANLTVAPGTGTGTGTISSLILQSPVAVGSGSGAQTQTTGWTIKAGVAVASSYTVANLPAAATAGAGAIAFVTDATQTAILGLGLAVVGGGANKVVVYCDATNWIII